MQEKAKPVAYVRRQGPICQVFVDPSTGSPAPLSSFDDEPIGTLPQTFTTQTECETYLRAYEIVYVDKPRNPKRATVAAVDPEKIRAVLGTSYDGAKASKAPPEPKKEASSQASLLALARIYLDKLECARKYASEANQDILDLKIETAQEMIEEVFSARQ